LTDAAYRIHYKYLLYIVLVIGALAMHCGRARALSEEGILLMEQGKQTSALDFFDRALRSNGHEPLALYGKGTLLTNEKITEDISIAMLKESVTDTDLKEPYRTRAFIRLAELYAGRRDKDEAMQQLSRIAAARLPDGTAVRRVAAIYLQLKEVDRAREALSAYLEVHPSDEEAEFLLLKLFVINFKDLKSAANLCTKIDPQKSRHPQFILNCSKVNALINDYTVALSLVDLYIKRTGQGNAKEIHDLREGILRKRGKFDLVAADF